MLPERGIVSFIRMKLGSGINPHEIKGMLLRAGFHTENIDQAFRYVKEKFADSHHELVASNDFLPELKKHAEEVVAPRVSTISRTAPVFFGSHIKLPLADSHPEHAVATPVSSAPSPSVSALHAHKIDTVIHREGSGHSTAANSQPTEAQAAPREQVLQRQAAVAGHVARKLKSKFDDNFVTHKGLFKGRLRRKDFTLGFLFFFAVGYVVLALSAVTISLVSPELWSAVLNVIEHDTNGVLLITIPVILAPITILMLSLITRRLHNLGMPGSLSWLFLVLFIPLDVSIFKGMWFLYIALGVLFIVLLAKKGLPIKNQYGDFPDSKGSFFKRIFNV